jgi:predicted metal-binding protein
MRARETSAKARRGHLQARQERRMNDLSHAAKGDAQQSSTDASVVISVCTTCKTQDTAAEVVGPNLLAALRDIVSSADGSVAVRAVQCLGVCKRPTTAAVSGPDRYTFVFADLQPDGAHALRDFALSYARSDYGLVPWRERAQVLRRGMIARIPPAIWSPENGEPPK